MTDAAVPILASATPIATPYVDTATAAQFIGMSESWLEHDRLAAHPEIPFSRFGARAVRYRVADLIAYGQSRVGKPLAA